MQILLKILPIFAAEIVPYDKLNLVFMKNVVVEIDDVRHHLVLDNVQFEYYCSSCSLCGVCSDRLSVGLCNVLKSDKHFYHFELDN